MDHPSLQSALREMQAVAQSRRLWLTFLAILAIFILTGPFGTSESMRFADRLLYWTIIQTSAWAIAIAFAVLANHLLAGRIEPILLRMMVGALIAALPIGLMLSVVDDSFHDKSISIASIAKSSLTSLPLCAIFCLLSYLTAHEKLVTTATANDTEERRIPLLDRLLPQNRAELLRLSVQDHYTDVVTTRGHQLVLLRFTDAIREVGNAKGLQVHRSHWISDADVMSLKKQAGRLFIVTRDGSEIPVSRSYSAQALARYADRVPIY